MDELQLVYREQTYVANLADVGLDPAASDSEVREIVERYFDLGRGALRNHQVTRPGRSRILISEKAVFGRLQRFLTMRGR
jgi:hypothetical protein